MTLLYGHEVEPPMSSTDYVTLLHQRMQDAHNLLRAQQHTMPVGEGEDLLYKVGDLVLVDSRQRRKGVNPKLQPQFVGPFRVSKAYCNHTYRLDGYRSLVSQSRLKLYRDLLANNPVRVPIVKFSSPPEAERQTELSDHGEDNLQQNTTTVEQTGNSMERTKDKTSKIKKGRSVRGADTMQARSTSDKEQQGTSSRTFTNSKYKEANLPLDTGRSAGPVRRSQRKRNKPDRLAY